MQTKLWSEILKRTLVKPNHKWEDIKRSLEILGWEIVGLIQQVENRKQWQAVVNIVMDLSDSKICKGSFDQLHIGVASHHLCPVGLGGLLVHSAVSTI